jgi:putative transposase
VYSYEERMRAVLLYIQYDHSASATVRELGYPTTKMLGRWYREYEATGELATHQKRRSLFSNQQQHSAVDYYFAHGRSISRTIKALGYPHRDALKQWIDNERPGERKVSVRRGSAVPYSQEHKRRAVIELCSREGSAAAVAADFRVERPTLYAWKRELLGEEDTKPMDEPDDCASPQQRDALQQEVESLHKRIHRLQLEHDILKKANELLKKDQGVNLQVLSNGEKTVLIDALRATYRLAELLHQLELPRSSYFYHAARLKRPGKYQQLRSTISEVFEINKRRYGYRRIGVALRRAGEGVSEKVIRRIMFEDSLVVCTRRRRGYASYNGEITPAVDNIVERNFHADAPNRTWLTDITEFQLPAGKVYLSPMIDCFDGMVVSWTIGTSPDAELVNTMLDTAIATLRDGKRPIVHSDRGCHYRWPGWISRMETAGLTRSMSKKGCSPDNAACEGFFGRLKNEMYYHRSWTHVSMTAFLDEIDSYIRWYNEERIKLSLGGKSPVEYRASLGLAA